MSEVEWWCPRCRVSHPPGRRVCIHCGGRVQRERDDAAPAAPRPASRMGAPPPTPIEGDEEEPGGAATRPLRIGVAVTWLVLALLGSLLRFCQEGSGG